MPAAQIIDSRGCHIGSGNGLYGGIVAVQSGDGEAATCVMGEPDKVALAVDGDSGDLVEGDAGVVDVVGVPVGAVEACNTDIACGGQPLVVVGIDFGFIQAVAGYGGVAGVIGVPACAVEAREPEAEFQSVKLRVARVAAV